MLQVDCANAGFAAIVTAAAASTASIRAILQRMTSAPDTPNRRANAAVFPNKII
jgi:hypothetical protein